MASTNHVGKLSWNDSCFVAKPHSLHTKCICTLCQKHAIAAKINSRRELILVSENSERGNHSNLISGNWKKARGLISIKADYTWPAGCIKKGLYRETCTFTLSICTHGLIYTSTTLQFLSGTALTPLKWPVVWNAFRYASTCNLYWGIHWPILPPSKVRT